jgi:hypothetical protein
LELTNTNSTNPLKGGSLFQLLSSYVSGGVLYVFFLQSSFDRLLVFVFIISQAVVVVYNGMM